MNKNELVHFIAKEANVKVSEADAALNALTNGITESLARNDNVTLVGFGTFQVKDRAARVGRNPKTGDSVTLEGKSVPHFKPGKEMRDRVNESIS
jgi:integration host factor beta subunit